MQIMHHPNRMILEYLLETLQDNYDQLEDRFGALRARSRRDGRQFDLLRKDHQKLQRDLLLVQDAVAHKTRLVEQYGLRMPTKSIRSTSCDTINHLIGSDFVYPHSSASSSHASFIGDGLLNGVGKSSYINGKCKSNHINNNNARPNYPPPPPPINGHGNDSGFASMNGCHLTNGDSYSTQRNGHATGKPPAPLPVSPDSGMESEDQQHPVFLSTTAFVQQVNGQLLSSKVKSAPNGQPGTSATLSTSSSHCFRSPPSPSSSSSTSSSSTHQPPPSHLLFTPKMAEFLHQIGGASLNDKLRNLLHSNQERRDQAKALRSKLNDEKIRSIKLEALSLLDHRQSGHSSARTRGSLHRKNGLIFFIFYFYLFLPVHFSGISL